MVFSTTALFKDVACPYGEQCELTSCIFSHELRPKQTSNAPADLTSISTSNNAKSHNDAANEPPAKRRKVTYDSAADKPPSRADLIRSQLANARSEVASTSKDTRFNSPLGKNGSASAPSNALPSLTRPVSPPPKNRKLDSRSHDAGANKDRPENSNQNNNYNKPDSKCGTEPKETLNPRLIANDPAGHSKRALYLKHLHGETVKLNRMVTEAKDLPHRDLLTLNEQELIKLALDDEERIAKDEPKVYDNKIKQRIAFYRKMRLEEWTQHVKATFLKEQPQPAGNKDFKPIETGLTAHEEVLIIPHLVADQSSLTPYGYIPTPPTEAQAAEAAAAVEASRNYEICDRCSTRFQVYLERNSEGKLTSNGPCMHHPNKKVFPQKTKGDVVSGFLKEPYHPCCNGLVGSPGCTEGADHVFKVSSPARLAAVLPFIYTPENESPAKDKCWRRVRAATFDCEMGYTTLGMELIRLTAVSWPDGVELLDVLVRPLGVVIDLNSRFSGVWPEHFANAIPYDQYVASSAASTPANGLTTSALPAVENPQKARELLCSFITPRTPLIGHAIDNDLNSVRLCHPTIVDTIVLYPHPRGLPLRFGLKMLSNKYLGRNIQTGGDRGHDSLEDAQATGDLVRVKVADKWKLLNAQGWRFMDDELVPPPPGQYDRGNANGSGSGYAERMLAMAMEGKPTGRKRKKRRPGEKTGDESTEDEEVDGGHSIGNYVQRLLEE